jgi:hypothetical protein
LRLSLPAELLNHEICKAKLATVGAAKYVMQIGLTAATRLDKAVEAHIISGDALLQHRSQVVCVCVCVCVFSPFMNASFVSSSGQKSNICTLTLSMNVTSRLCGFWKTV